MKKMIVLAGLVLLAATVPVGATTVWQNVGFDTLWDGAISYDDNGGNVVVPGTAFYDKVHYDPYLGTPTAPGNIGVYGVVEYSDPHNVLGWAASHPTTPFGLEFRLQIDVPAFDTDADLNADFSDHFKLVGTDVGVAALTTTFAELAAPGYVELIPNIVWMDLALDSTNYPGKAAFALVLNGFQNTSGWTLDNSGMLNGLVVPSSTGVPLGGPVPNNLVGSGLLVGHAIPEPMTMACLFMGVTGLAGYIRKRRMA